MDKNSISDFQKKLNDYIKEGKIPVKLFKSLESFYESYLNISLTPEQKISLDKNFSIFLDLVVEQHQNPYEFESFHKRIRSPFDYHAFGINFLRPLVDKSTSTISNIEYLEEVLSHINKKHNVIFLANHQAEADPQALSLLLEEQFPKLAEEMIFVAGDRVVTDPFAIPFSMGCNLLCIYSKRYIDKPPEKKHQKQLHNKRAMQLMSALLSEGGHCIYVAPSGGRDRRNKTGEIEIAPFDPKSIEMFYLMSKKAKHPTHFYPMTLGTYEMMPPPETIQVEIGEKRLTKRVGIHISIGSEIDMEKFPGHENTNKSVRRKCRADYIWDLVNQEYQKFPR